MNQYLVSLYDFCNHKEKEAIQDFCDRVNHSDADVFIIMAHKAVLLFDLLIDQGFIGIQAKNKVIISNFALEFDCSYLEGKKIAILDDIVISGTTISSTVNKLLSVGVNQNDIEVIAIAIDEDYFNMDFSGVNGTTVLHCNHLFEDAPCIELSAIVSKAFSYYGIPYDVDFPVYNYITINEKMLNSLHNNLLWDIIDVSNVNQRSGGITAFVLSPA